MFVGFQMVSMFKMFQFAYSCNSPVPKVSHPDSFVTARFAQLMKLAMMKLKSLLRVAWLPQEGTRQQVVLRLLRYLADWGPVSED